MGIKNDPSKQGFTEDTYLEKEPRLPVGRLFSLWTITELVHTIIDFSMNFEAVFNDFSKVFESDFVDFSIVFDTLFYDFSKKTKPSSFEPGSFIVNISLAQLY